MVYIFFQFLTHLLTYSLTYLLAHFKGRVSLEEFVIVTIERLLKLSFDTDVHESIAQEILSSELTNYSLLLDALKATKPTELFANHPTCKRVRT